MRGLRDFEERQLALSAHDHVDEVSLSVSSGSRLDAIRRRSRGATGRGV